MGFTFGHSGNFNRLEKFLRTMEGDKIYAILDSYGSRGVSALAAATPKDSGETAMLWRYEVKKSGGSYQLSWFNDNVVFGVNVAVILQYGHGTGTGGYVQGRDYINPAIQQVMDQLVDGVWKAVISA